MKILAIIPARAGSKGIPNKNVRLICGKPLVSYAIENSKNSQYITDVIVSTDSHLVKTIAEQMGVKVKWRDESLCGDEVTLDSVIADAIPDEDGYDYVISMQPTSPTLKSITLDEAINYTIDNKLDTVISAINAPHLSWKSEGGKKKPNYEQRLNRQYLPENYLETGAFVISKASVVTPETRIGTSVDIFEISEDEAIDIDSFYDLMVAEEILKRKKVAIYVNGNNKRGIGHIYRALEIADEFYIKPDIFFDLNQTKKEVFGETAHNLIPVNGIAEMFEVCKKEQYSIFINDILTTSIDYMIGLRSVLPDAKLINIEDDGEGAIKADAVFNALYEKNELSRVYAGEQYFIPNKLFMFYNPIRIRDEATTMFICFGGADPQNYTDNVLNLVSKEEYKDKKFVVALGRAKNNVEELMRYNEKDNVRVYYDVPNMPELMSQCDIALASRGRTCYELAILGIPTISIAENERENKHGFVSNENGFSFLGVDPDMEVIEDHIRMYFDMPKRVRQMYHETLLSHDLRNGRKNFMTIINSI